MEKNIEHELMNIELLLGNHKFEIPSFQRRYEWSSEEIEALILDIVNTKSINYFIGVGIFERDSSKSSTLRIIDGQQRVITCLLILKTLYYIYEEDKNDLFNDIFLVLKRVLSHQNSALRIKISNSDKLDFDDYFFDLSYRDYIPNNKFYKLEKQIRLFYREQLESKNLLTLVNKILNTEIIFLYAKDNSSAFEIFETLNSRGKELEASDLLKNYLLNKLNDERDPREDKFMEKWKTLESLLDAKDAKKMTKYIRFFWLSKYQYISQNKIYTSIRNHLDDEFSKNQYNHYSLTILDQIHDFAEIYQSLDNPNDSKLIFTNDSMQRTFIEKLNRLSIFLNIFKITQPIIFLVQLIMIDKKHPQKIKNQFNKFFEYFEAVLFKYFFIGNGRANILENICANIAKAIRETNLDDKDISQINQSLDLLSRKMIEFCKPLDVYQNDIEDMILNKVFYYNNYKKDINVKATANLKILYILIKYFYENDSFLMRKLSSNSKTIDLSVDHIIPEIKYINIIEDRHIISLGNLAVLTKAENRIKGEKSILDVVEVYTKSNLSKNHEIATQIKSINHDNLELVELIKKRNSEIAKRISREIALALNI